MPKAQQSAEKKQGLHHNKRSVHVNGQPIFVRQNLIYFRRDLPSEENKEVQRLKREYGKGPFLTTKVEDDPAYPSVGSKHPQMVQFICDYGNLRSESGFLFTKQ